MADDKTPAPAGAGEQRSGSADKPAGGAKGGANDTKAPPPKRG